MYEVVANLCDGSDYVAHWDGGKFERYEDAEEFYDNWWPPRDEVLGELREDAAASGTPIGEYDLQIGVWDEDGYDLDFWSERFTEDDLEVTKCE